MLQNVLFGLGEWEDGHTPTIDPALPNASLQPLIRAVAAATKAMEGGGFVGLVWFFVFFGEF